MNLFKLIMAANANKNTAPQGISAMEMVLSSPALLPEILGHIVVLCRTPQDYVQRQEGLKSDILTLVRLRGVSKFWKTCIDTTATLQKRLFLKKDDKFPWNHPNPVLTVTDNVTIGNIHVRTPFAFAMAGIVLDHMGRPFFWPTTFGEREPESDEYLEKLMEPIAMWRKMYPRIQERGFNFEIIHQGRLLGNYNQWEELNCTDTLFFDRNLRVDSFMVYLNDEEALEETCLHLYQDWDKTWAQMADPSTQFPIFWTMDPPSQLEEE
jgi:hypothetical protein